nr:primase-helicase zinc-binding domain-containing protein [Klebsiella pneumoniae]
MRNIDLIREVTHAAAGRWPSVLAGLSIDVPDSSRRHSPCPACGGKDRFRFDDNGRGSFICNQCGAGDGLDLIKQKQNGVTYQPFLMMYSISPVTTHKPKQRGYRAYARARNT